MLLRLQAGDRCICANHVPLMLVCGSIVRVLVGEVEGGTGSWEPYFLSLQRDGMLHVVPCEGAVFSPRGPYGTEGMPKEQSGASASDHDVADAVMEQQFRRTGMLRFDMAECSALFCPSTSEDQRARLRDQSREPFGLTLIFEQRGGPLAGARGPSRLAFSAMLREERDVWLRVLSRHLAPHAARAAGVGDERGLEESLGLNEAAGDEGEREVWWEQELGRAMEEVQDALRSQTRALEQEAWALRGEAAALREENKGRSEDAVAAVQAAVRTQLAARDALIVRTRDDLAREQAISDRLRAELAAIRRLPPESPLPPQPPPPAAASLRRAVTESSPAEDRAGAPAAGARVAASPRPTSEAECQCDVTTFEDVAAFLHRR